MKDDIKYIILIQETHSVKLLFKTKIKEDNKIFRGSGLVSKQILQNINHINVIVDFTLLILLIFQVIISLTFSIVSDLTITTKSYLPYTEATSTIPSSLLTSSINSSSTSGSVLIKMYALGIFYHKIRILVFYINSCIIP